MAAKQSKLAKKYRKALDAVDAARADAEAAREEWFPEARKARKALLDELGEFATEAGIPVEALSGRLALAHGGRTLIVTDAVEGDTLDTTGGVRFVVSPEGEWTAEGPIREPLIDKGLRRLLVTALGLPDPLWELSEKPAAKPKAAKAAKPAKVKAAPIAVPEPEPEPTPAPTPAPAVGDGKGPNTGEVGHLGRSGTRGFKRARDVSPGGLIKDLKGPGPV